MSGPDGSDWLEKLTVAGEPSATGVLLPSAAVGATFAIVTTWLAVLPAAPSESVACAETVELAGPSGKVQSKEPEVLVLLAFDLFPLPPQLVATELTVS